MNEIREKYYGGENASKEAFEELCAMVENMTVGIIYHNIQKKNNQLFCSKRLKGKKEEIKLRPKLYI